MKRHSEIYNWTRVTSQHSFIKNLTGTHLRCDVVPVSQVRLLTVRYSFLITIKKLPAFRTCPERFLCCFIETCDVAVVIHQNNVLNILTTLSVFGIKFIKFQFIKLHRPSLYEAGETLKSVDKQWSYLLKRWIQQRTSGSTVTSLHINVHKMPCALCCAIHAHFGDNVIYMAFRPNRSMYQSIIR